MNFKFLIQIIFSMSDNGFDKYIKNEVKVLAEYNMNVLKNKIKLEKEDETICSEDIKQKSILQKNEK